jgi:sugar lactone lactonase YvrE
MKTLFRKLAHHSIIPSFHHSILIILAIDILLLPLKSFGAETVKFRPLLSIYSDNKGAGLKEPEGVACSEKSILIVGDTENGRLLRFTFEEKTVKGGTEIKVPELSYPIRIQMNAKGEIFALDEKQRRVVRLSPEGEFKGYVPSEGLPAASTIIPRSMKIDANDTIYLLDIFSGRVWILNPDGKYQKQVPFPKDYGFFSDLAVDARGNIFLIDSVRAVLFSAKKDSDQFTPLTKNLRENLDFPTSLTTDSRGTIYVVDQNRGGIVLLGQDGSFLGRQLGMGWNEGLLYYPSQICINEKGEAFIADRGNSRIQIFNLVK